MPEALANLKPPSYADKDFGEGTSNLAAYRAGYFDARQDAILALPEIFSALLSDEVVEAVAAALHDEEEYRNPSGDPPDGWCPPGHDVHQEPPREPLLWEQMVAEGKYPGTQEEHRKKARAALQAAIEQVGGGQG